MSKNLFIRFSIVFLVITIGFLCWDNRESRLLRSQVKDLELRLAEAELKPVVRYIHDSVPAFETKIVEVDKTDYKKQLADRELIKELKLKISQVEAENQLLLSTRDTVDMKPVGDSTLRYMDEWAYFSYNLPDNRLYYAVRDSLTTFVTREYKHRFLWWRWGTKGYNVYVVSHNPHATVEYNKYIKVKK